MAYKDPEKHREAVRKWNAAHPEKMRENCRRWRAANLENARERVRKYQTEHREEINERVRRSRAEHPDRQREWDRKCLYGLALGEYDALLTVQDGRCAICGRGDEHLCVDHNHVTGVVRGLLCRKCNGGVGLLQDNPGLLREAADYLEKETR